MDPTTPRGEKRGRRQRPSALSFPFHSPPRVSLLLLLSLSPCLFTPALSLGEAPAYHQQLQSWSHLLHEASDPERAAEKISRVEEQLGSLLDLTSSQWRDALFRVASSGDGGGGGGDVIDDALMASLEANGTTSTFELCLNHTLAVLAGLSNRDKWALQMLDAMGKPSFGLMDLNVIWPGGYNQCLKVRANTSVISHPFFSGRYCNIYSNPPNPQNPMANIVATLGICVPDTCTGSDVTLLVNMVVTALNVNSSSLKPYATCEEGSRSIDARAVVAIIICSIIGVLMVVGTAVDVLCIQMPKWSASTLNGETPHHIDSSAGSTSESNHVHQDMNNPEEALLLPKHGVKAAPASPPQLGVLGHAVVAFSVYTNGSKLLNTRQPPGSLTCVHGLRFLSMSWVVLGHSWGSPLSIGMNLGPYLQQVTSNWAYQGILNATVSVDSFFVLSGLLVTYLTMKEMKKNGGSLNWFLFYFHRFWRLTPAYMLVIMVYVCLAPYWGYGPFWPHKFIDQESCEKNWWTNLLYVNNIVRTKESCFGHSWYLANDMQFYILSPLIFVPLFFSPVVGMVVAGVFLLATSITPGVLSQHYKLPPGLLQTVEGAPANGTGLFDYFDIYYLKPYNRMGAYIVGMLAGYFLYRSNCRLRIHWVTNMSLWALFTACALAVLYGLYEPGSPGGHPLTVPVAALYNAVNRQVWGACIAWVVVACVTGNGGFVNTILSWPGMVPLSRLSYCIYLIHLPMLGIFVQNQHNTIFIDDLNLVLFYLSVLVASSALAFVFSLTFEAPMMGLERVFLRRPRTEPKH